MNNTRTLAIVAVLTAATLVVGLTVAATMTTSAFAGGSKRYGHDKYMKGKGQDSYKKDGHDKYMKGKGQDSYKKDGNGNTNTIQVLKQNAKADKFSIVEQNGENSICTHPSSSSPDSTDLVEGGSNPTGSCTSQSNQPPFGVS
jgi:hypothetical protein